MTVEVDERYADAKARIRRSDRKELLDQLRPVYGERSEAVLARLTMSAPPTPVAASPAVRGGRRRTVGSKTLTD